MRQMDVYAMIGIKHDGWRRTNEFFDCRGFAYGKTLLAQKLLEKYKYPYLSLDLLKMGLIRSGNTALTPEDDEALEAYLWPIAREMIRTAMENR